MMQANDQAGAPTRAGEPEDLPAWIAGELLERAKADGFRWQGRAGPAGVSEALDTRNINCQRMNP